MTVVYVTEVGIKLKILEIHHLTCNENVHDVLSKYQLTMSSLVDLLFLVRLSDIIHANVCSGVS